LTALEHTATAAVALAALTVDALARRGGLS
jgi:hypothetical protein